MEVTVKPPDWTFVSCTPDRYLPPPSSSSHRRGPVGIYPDDGVYVWEDPEGSTPEGIPIPTDPGLFPDTTLPSEPGTPDNRRRVLGNSDPGVPNPFPRVVTYGVRDPLTSPLGHPLPFTQGTGLRGSLATGVSPVVRPRSTRLGGTRFYPSGGTRPYTGVLRPRTPATHGF